MRLKLLWAKHKRPFLWMVTPLALYLLGYHLYTDHRNLHAMVEWSIRADRDLTAIKTRLAPPHPEK